MILLHSCIPFHGITSGLLLKWLMQSAQYPLFYFTVGGIYQTSVYLCHQLQYSLRHLRKLFPVLYFFEMILMWGHDFEFTVVIQEFLFLFPLREDVPPPKSRVSTARSFTVGSQRSSLGSMSPSNLHEYALKQQYDKIPSSEEYERPPSHVPHPPPAAVKMAGPNLSRMGAIPVMVPAQNRDGSIV